MLRNIVETKREEIAQLYKRSTLQSMLDRAQEREKPRGFRNALITSTRPVSVIAEVKKASPSKGLIRAEFEPVTIAQAYAHAQVEAISVLTDQSYFQGDINYLLQIHEAVPSPLLRKDFLLDELQIVEARAFGADCILLIAAILDGLQLQHLYETATSLGMDVLIEVHDQADVDKVHRFTNGNLIGINNRDLRSFHVDLQTTASLIHQLPAGVSIVSESGIGTIADVAFVQKAGARSILVGEHFMRQEDIASSVNQLVGERVLPV